MRLNATTKAPIVNFCGEAAQGATTIRAFQMVEKFKRKNLCLIDNDSTLYFHNNAALEWFVQRLEFLSYLVLCAVALLLVIFPTSSSGWWFSRLSKTVSHIEKFNNLSSFGVPIVIF